MGWPRAMRRLPLDRPLDVAFFVSHDGASGTFFRYHNLARGLVNRGHRVTVHSQSYTNSRTNAVREEDGVRYVVPARFPGNRWISFDANPGNILRRQLGSIARVARADVYHLFQPFANAAWQWRRVRRARRGDGGQFFWDWDDLWAGGRILPENARGLNRLTLRLIESLEHRLPALADAVTTCSGFLARLARERGARETAVVLNGLWPELCPPRVESRRALGLREDAFYLTFLGWTPDEVSWCFQALERLLPVLPAARLVCCGYIPEGELRAHPALADRVDVLGDVAPEKAHAVACAADLGLLPLAHTPFNESRLPIKFAGYLAAGLPVACSEIGEIAALGRQLRGVLFAPPHREGWVLSCVDSALAVARNPGAYKPERQALLRLLDWNAIAGQLEEFYLRPRAGGTISPRI